MCGDDELRLVSASVNLQTQYIEMAEEFVRQDGSARYQERLEEALADFGGFVRRLHEADFGMNLAEGRVPATTYWLMKGKRLIGTATLRHRLTEHLLLVGGQIGYDIRPSERRRGYGRRQLELVLEKARQRFLSRVLVTCDVGNVGSERIIESSGGVEEGRGFEARTGREVRRYWIDLWAEAAAPLPRWETEEGKGKPESAMAVAAARRSRGMLQPVA